MVLKISERLAPKQDEKLVAASLCVHSPEQNFDISLEHFVENKSSL